MALLYHQQQQQSPYQRPLNQHQQRPPYHQQQQQQHQPPTSPLSVASHRQPRHQAGYFAKNYVSVVNDSEPPELASRRIATIRTVSPKLPARPLAQAPTMYAAASHASRWQAGRQ